jgi:hypothetical protein
LNKKRSNSVKALKRAVPPLNRKNSGLLASKGADMPASRRSDVGSNLANTPAKNSSLFMRIDHLGNRS